MGRCLKSQILKTVENKPSEFKMPEFFDSNKVGGLRGNFAPPASGNSNPKPK